MATTYSSPVIYLSPLQYEEYAMFLRESTLVPSLALKPLSFVPYKRMTVFLEEFDKIKFRVQPSLAQIRTWLWMCGIEPNPGPHTGTNWLSYAAALPDAERIAAATQPDTMDTPRFSVIVKNRRKLRLRHDAPTRVEGFKRDHAKLARKKKVHFLLRGIRRCKTRGLDLAAASAAAHRERTSGVDQSKAYRRFEKTFKTSAFETDLARFRRTGAVPAFSSAHEYSVLRPSCPSWCSTVQHRKFLLLCGDVEENPGPRAKGGPKAQKQHEAAHKAGGPKQMSFVLCLGCGSFTKVGAAHICKCQHCSGPHETALCPRGKAVPDPLTIVRAAQAAIVDVGAEIVAQVEKRAEVLGAQVLRQNTPTPPWTPPTPTSPHPEAGSSFVPPEALESAILALPIPTARGFVPFSTHGLPHNDVSVPMPTLSHDMFLVHQWKSAHISALPAGSTCSPFVTVPSLHSAIAKLRRTPDMGMPKRSDTRTGLMTYSWQLKKAGINTSGGDETDVTAEAVDRVYGNLHVKPDDRQTKIQDFVVTTPPVSAHCLVSQLFSFSSVFAHLPQAVREYPINLRVPFLAVAGLMMVILGVSTMDLATSLIATSLCALDIFTVVSFPYVLSAVLICLPICVGSGLAVGLTCGVAAVVSILLHINLRKFARPSRHLFVSPTLLSSLLYETGENTIELLARGARTLRCHAAALALPASVISLVLKGTLEVALLRAAKNECFQSGGPVAPLEVNRRSLGASTRMACAMARSQNRLQRPPVPPSNCCAQMCRSAPVAACLGGSRLAMSLVFFLRVAIPMILVRSKILLCNVLVLTSRTLTLTFWRNCRRSQPCGLSAICVHSVHSD